MDPAAQRTLRAGWWAMLLVAALAVAAYVPALRAGWIWDDDSYVTENPVVQRADGVLEAWVPGSTPQYYPLVFVSFWTQHAVHGLEPFGYHLVNVLLHVASSVLLWRLLAALRVPGALLAAGLFALHPVQVESVAWVTERKNVLSMAFALGSLRCWVRFLDDPRSARERAGWWGASFLLFVLAMLSKTTAVAVPVAMAAIAWWRGAAPMRARTTAALLAPFFAVGAAMGLLTAWVEATHVGASGAEFARPFLDRLLGAAQAWWFYLSTWAWPRGLMFVYPPFGGPSWLPWAALLGGVAVAAAAAIAARRGTRGPMAFFLAYSAGVFPALGFVNLYPLRFAPVADHFGYVGSAALAAASGWLLASSWDRLAARGVPRRAGIVLCGVVAAALASMTWSHALRFADAETLWQVSLAENPRAWLAANNLARARLDGVQEAIDAGDRAARDRLLGEAAELVERSAALAGAIDMPVQSNLSEVRRLQGRLPEALAAIDAAIAIQPDAPGPHWQRGRLVELLGRFPEAGPEYARAVELSPRSVIYLRERVRWLTKSGRLPEARDVAARIAEVAPGDAEALANLGSLELELGNVAAGRKQLLRALSFADDSLAPMIAVRAVRACLAAPVERAAAEEGRAIAERLVRDAGGSEPLSLLLLARAQAVLREPAAAETLRRAEALLAPAPQEIRDAAGPEVAATKALLGGVPGTAPPAPDAPAGSPR